MGLEELMRLESGVALHLHGNPLLRGNGEFTPHGPDSPYQLLKGGEVGFCLRIVPLLPSFGIGGGDEGPPVSGQFLVDLFGDEREDRVHQLEAVLQDVNQQGDRPVLLRLVLAVEGEFGRLDVPVAEIVPEELVDALSGVVEPVDLQGLPDLGDGCVETVKNPLVHVFQYDGIQRLESASFQVHEDVPGGVPHLVGKL